VFDQDQNLVFGAFNFKFDSTIIEIPDTSAESSLRCDASCKRSIPDSLDLSLHKQLRTESSRFNRFGHTLRQTARYNDAYPTNGYSHTSAEASRVLRFRASEFRTTVLKSKMEMLKENRCTAAWRNNSNVQPRVREFHE